MIDDAALLVGEAERFSRMVLELEPRSLRKERRRQVGEDREEIAPELRDVEEKRRGSAGILIFLRVLLPTPGHRLAAGIAIYVSPERKGKAEAGAVMNGFA